uniref:Glycosyltransferase n=1 Tax=viral metagenome TaxID=1070528 RepID=A0A6C0KRN5_9ZZZZ
MITCNLQGGLGNQLFQIFTTLSYALKYSKAFFFINIPVLTNGSIIRYTYWETFLSNLKPFLKNKNDVIQLIYLKENGFLYEDIKIPQNQNIMLVGYFQSHMYFDKYKNMICKLIKLDEKKQIVKERMGERMVENVISMHFRLGDYKKLPEYHPILGERYYINSISYILKEQTNKNRKVSEKILYFCEDDDFLEVEKTIKILESNFPLLKFERENSFLNDWEQLLQMSFCSYNIIANSTFSWWGAYLNNNNEKIVCYPDEWFGKKVSHNTSTLFPEDWIKIDTK